MSYDDTPDPDDVASRVQTTGNESYNQSIERDCVDCMSWVKVSGRYANSWDTPMAGAPFRVSQNGEVVAEGRLKSISDLGKRPGDPLTDADLDELGTFVVQDVPPGPIVFEILAEGSEGEILRLEQECVAETARGLRAVRDQYANEWRVWEDATTSGRAQLLLSTSFESFLNGASSWWEEERGFWASIGEVFSAAWDAIVDALGDLAEALHPRNIAQTAQAVWDGAVAGAQAVSSFVADLPDAARELYAGTVRIIENAGAITQFMGDFVSGDWRGVEDFVTITLPRLIEDDSEAARWREFIINNAEAWQVVLEIVGYTKGPALLMAACAGLCAAVPPQVWAQWGVASVALVAIEVAVSAVIGLLAAAATALSGGAAGAALAAVIVGRAAKWGRMGSRAAESITNLLTFVDGLIDRIVQMGQASVRGRRRMTTDSGERNGATEQQSEQRRENEGGRCRNCGSRLGVGRHPEDPPNFRDGNTSKDSGYRARIIAQASGNTSSLASRNLEGDAAAHHLISAEGVSSSGHATKLEKLGYDINVNENLSLVPSNGFLSCYLKCQLHRGDHTWGAYNYHQQVEREIDDITGDLEHYCLQRPPTNDIQPDMDRKSMILATKVDRFMLPLTQVAADFRPSDTRGCSNVNHVRHTQVDCTQGRSHASEFALAGLSVPYRIAAGK